MELKELYSIYGEQLIQLEILNGKINETKKQIVENINQPRKLQEK
jgi:hypothetical protein